LATLFRLINFDIHSIAIYEGDSMGGIALSSMFEIYWVTTIEISPWGNHSSISRPKGSCVVHRGKHHWVCMLTQSVKYWVRG
jgi:hypothetical protein